MAMAASSSIFALFACFLLLQGGMGLQLDEVEEASEHGDVLELTDATLNPALSKYDHILVDFYAPWCQLCQSLSHELDNAAPVLATGSPPIIVAKINADKYRSMVSSYDIRFFPTLKFFTNGYPTDYNGPHSASTLVTQVRRLTAPAIEVYTSESHFRDSIRIHGSELPIFVGFGLESFTLEKLAHKYRNRGWFGVLGEFSEHVMLDFNFDKRPALVVLNGEHEVQDIFYGPFEGSDLAKFVKLNVLPLVTPLTVDNLKLLIEDGRPNVVTVLDSDTSLESKTFIKKMKAAAQAHRSFVFTSVVASQWPKFVRPFKLGKRPVLPTVIIWDGQHYSKSDKADAFVGDSMESELSELLQGYTENRVKREIVAAPTFYEKATENYVTMAQALGLLAMMVFTMWRKNKEHRAAWQQENREGVPGTSREPDGQTAVKEASVKASKED